MSKMEMGHARVIRQDMSTLESGTEHVEKVMHALRELLAKNGGQGDFFSSKIYEDHELARQFCDVIGGLSAYAYDLLMQGEPMQALEIGRDVLEIVGVQEAGQVSLQSPDGAIALAEAMNLAAKVLHWSLYALKPPMIVAASKIDGVHFGFAEDEEGDGVYYLGSPTIGVASFHDVGDEVGYFLTHQMHASIPRWEYAWTGVSRQEDAFRILEDLSSGRGLVKVYADATTPEEMRVARDRYMKENYGKRFVTLGEVLKYKGQA